MAILGVKKFDPEKHILLLITRENLTRCKKIAKSEKRFMRYSDFKIERSDWPRGFFAKKARN